MPSGPGAMGEGGRSCISEGDAARDPPREPPEGRGAALSAGRGGRRPAGGGRWSSGGMDMERMPEPTRRDDDDSESSPLLLLLLLLSVLPLMLLALPLLLGLLFGGGSSASCRWLPSSGRGGKGAPGRGNSAASAGGEGERPGVAVIVWDERMLMPHWSYVSIFFIMFSYVSPILRGLGATEAPPGPRGVVPVRGWWRSPPVLLKPGESSYRR
mmetsp:Transcript_23549/g.59153  ORF Transcript_23549/g.59153 Transcript_23549/m.59153 type:complete len:213 (-) Transcript_23549:863-1501(-)